IDKNPDTTHVLLHHNSTSTPIGTLRYTHQPKQKISRIAILRSYRGKGAGKALMRLFEQHLIYHTPSLVEKKILLHSQIQVIPFYQNIGYKIQGEIFLVEDGEPHQLMVKELFLPSTK
ncbi:hypothetical protein CROQUDRAFT_666416, partial [Cronartium quercuum f. sp. fusiforme G11]